MNIVIAPNPLLSSKSTEVQIAGQEERLLSLIDEMFEIMYATNGCGLAAPQIGLNERIVVVDCEQSDDEEGSGNPIVLINPRILEYGDETVEYPEGCLSVPGIQVRLVRPERVIAEWEGIDGKTTRMEADGLLARCIQHEIDHLDGMTMLDRLQGVKRMEGITKYNAALKLGAFPGSEKIFYEV